MRDSTITTSDHATLHLCHLWRAVPRIKRSARALPICEDERQYIGWKGQQWTTLDKLRADHHNTLRTEEPNLTGIGTEPGFAIAQRALLVQAPGGNVPWDCITLIDEATVEAVRALGGISAIAISHPHYYSAMVAGTVSVRLHLQCVVRPCDARRWKGRSRPIGRAIPQGHRRRLIEEKELVLVAEAAPMAGD